MRRLVADLLLLARHDAARKAPHTPTDVGQVLVEAAAEVGAIAHEHELSIDASRAVVDGARDELHRLALNLMENAIRHTPAGTHVHAAVERVEGVVRVTVEDDGPGIPADLRERVFERFVRGVGDRGGSSGLGLSIVHAVAASHGGSVTIESPTSNGAGRPRGTRFEVTLPLSASTQRETATSGVVT
jgi:signal transduction histidine kinase